MKINNPFTTSGYLGADYFCDREKETRQLLEAVKSNRNLTLISLRRMGKTALLRHIQGLLPDRDFEVIYLDLLPTQSSAELLNLLGTALLNVRNKEKKFIDKVLSTLSNLRPLISYDSLSGQPTVSLTVTNDAEVGGGIRQIIELVSALKLQILIILDEFQQINFYQDKNLEALLRSVVQQYPSISFIFSGSNKHMLETMFTSASRPFFGSAEIINLDPIPINNYIDFIKAHFNKANKVITPETIADIINWCRNHTYYVQYFCNRLYASDSTNIDLSVVNKMKLEILESFSPSFLTYRNLLTKTQFDLLRAVALENGIEKPLAGNFIEKHRLKSASTVKTSLDALASKEMLVYSNNSWHVYDVFLMRWLEYYK